MDSQEQAAAYAKADFDDAHKLFVDQFAEKIGEVKGRVLDLGCGPCHVTLLFARNNPDCMVFGVDGSKAMLHEAQRALSESPDIAGRIILLHDELASLSLPQRSCDVIISNSLLHHLHKPQFLWNAIRMFASANAWVFIMDLFRPVDEQKAREIVETYSKNEPDILKKDFFNSLCAAFEPKDIEQQLKEAGLDHLTMEVVSDRHMIVYGRM